MNVGGVTVVGTATITAADDLLTITAHGLADGDLVMIDTLTGGGAELREGSTYVVRSPTADTFRLSTPSGAELWDFDSDGSARVLSAVPSYAAVDLRRINAINLHPGSADRLGAREGVRPHSSDPVTVASTTYTVAEGVAVVYPAQTTTSGPYPVTYDATSASLDPADGTNPRLDGIDLQVQDDDEDGSGQRRVQIVYVPGTPASSPAAPAVTANSLRLATILVPAGGTPAPSVDSLAQYALGAATVPVRDTSERPSSPYHGMKVYRQDTDTEEVWDGSAWLTLASTHIPESVLFTSSSTFTKANYPHGRYVVVEGVGGGGGGGGAGATVADQGAVGGGGGAGGYFRKIIPFTSLTASETVTVGAAGSAGAAGLDGGTGGTTSFGAHASATGGTGGDGTGAIDSYTNASGGNGGTASNGDLNITGSDGQYGINISTDDTTINRTWGGMGGGSHLSGMRRISGADAGDVGLAGHLYGGGGSGAYNDNQTQSGKAGGAGAAGVVIVTVH